MTRIKDLAEELLSGDVVDGDFLVIEDLSESKTKKMKVSAITDRAGIHKSFGTRNEFVAWAALNTPIEDAVIEAEGVKYRYNAGATGISDLAGYSPVGTRTPQHHGAKGDGAADDRPAFLEMNTAGGLVYIPAPTTRYEISSALALDNVTVTVAEDASFAATTDSGNLTWTDLVRGWNASGTDEVGFFRDDTPGTVVHRFRDRGFVGDAVKHTANRVSSNGLGGSKLTENGANWFEKNAQFSVGSTEDGGRIGVLGYSVVLPTESSNVPTGVAAVLVNKGENSSGRALYAEAMHGGNATASTGLEIQVGNYSTTAPVANAYAMGSVTTIGLAIGAEAGHNYTTGDSDTPVATPTQPAGCAIDILGGSIDAAYQKLMTGIVIRQNALVRDGSSHAVAMSLAEGHEITWGASGTYPNLARIRSDSVSLANTDVGIIFDNSEVKIVGDGERSIAVANDVASAVNYMSITNAATGAPVDLAASGTDTNIDLRLAGKGTGKVRFGTHAGIGAETVTGYIEIKDSGGTVRKLAVVS